MVISEQSENVRETEILNGPENMEVGSEVQGISDSSRRSSFAALTSYMRLHPSPFKDAPALFPGCIQHIPNVIDSTVPASSSLAPSALVVAPPTAINIEWGVSVFPICAILRPILKHMVNLYSNPIAPNPASTRAPQDTQPNVTTFPDLLPPA